MTITASALQPGSPVGTTTAQLFAATTATQITSAIFTNTNSGTVNLTVFLARQGSPAGSGNILIDAQVLAEGQAYIANELAGRNLAQGDAVLASATVGGVVNAIIDGFTIT